MQKYLRFAGVVGKPRVRNFRAAGTDTMYRGGSTGMRIATQQYNFFDDPARFYYLRSSLYGIPVDGLHRYAGDSATMQVNAAYLIPLVNAGGERMAMSETVTFFNDMCLFAPATLVAPEILWEPVDPRTVWARFTCNGITISAMLYFVESGKLRDFVSDDRYMSPDGRTFSRYQWSTPVKKYQAIDGRTVPAACEASWKMPEGDFTYVRFTLDEIEYNCTEFR